MRLVVLAAVVLVGCGSQSVPFEGGAECPNSGLPFRSLTVENERLCENGTQNIRDAVSQLRDLGLLSAHLDSVDVYIVNRRYVDQKARSLGSMDGQVGFGYQQATMTIGGTSEGTVHELLHAYELFDLGVSTSDSAAHKNWSSRSPSWDDLSLQFAKLIRSRMTAK